jgi:hypothetical protein
MCAYLWERPIPKRGYITGARNRKETFFIILSFIIFSFALLKYFVHIKHLKLEKKEHVSFLEIYKGIKCTEYVWP